MKKPEQLIEDDVVAWAEHRGIGTRKLSWVGRKSAPDRFFVKGNRICVIEFKAPKGKLDPLQVEEHKWFAEHGHKVPVFDNTPDAIDYLRYFYDI